MSDTKDFINAYSELERELKAFNRTVLEYEESLNLSDPALSDKLKVCRICRNYIQHHRSDETFISPTQEQTDFLWLMAGNVSGKGGLSKCCSKVPSVSTKTERKSVLKILDQSLPFGFVTVVDHKNDNILGILSSSQLLNLYMVSSGKTYFDKDTLIRLSSRYVCDKDYIVLKDSFIGHIPERTPIVVVHEKRGGTLSYAGIYMYPPMQTSFRSAKR